MAISNAVESREDAPGSLSCRPGSCRTGRTPPVRYTRPRPADGSTQRGRVRISQGRLRDAYHEQCGYRGRIPPSTLVRTHPAILGVCDVLEGCPLTVLLRLLGAKIRMNTVSIYSRGAAGSLAALAIRVLTLPRGASQDFTSAWGARFPAGLREEFSPRSRTPLLFCRLVVSMPCRGLSDRAQARELQLSTANCRMPRDRGEASGRAVSKLAVVMLQGILQPGGAAVYRVGPGHSCPVLSERGSGAQSG